MTGAIFEDLYGMAADIHRRAADVPQHMQSFVDRIAAEMREAGARNALLRVGHPGLAASVSARGFNAAGAWFVTLEAGDARDPAVKAMARVQDEGSGYLPGGRITPRYAKFLAIPTQAAKAAGFGNTPWHLHPRRDVRWIPRRAGEGFVLILNGIHMYTLVRSVILRPTWYLRDAFVSVAETVGDRLLTELHVFTTLRAA